MFLWIPALSGTVPGVWQESISTSLDCSMPLSACVCEGSVNAAPSMKPLRSSSERSRLALSFGSLWWPILWSTDHLPLYTVVVCPYVSSSAVLYKGKIRVQLISAPPCHLAPVLHVHLCWMSSWLSVSIYCLLNGRCTTCVGKELRVGAVCLLSCPAPLLTSYL